WTQDWNSDTFYSTSGTTNPVNTVRPANSYRIVRGAAYGYGEITHRIAFRYGFPYTSTHKYFGIRLALSAQ
ncbi:MAG: hypothetical protein LBT94_09950, partial [Prevotellaceae bacterium]|nr:hypothetical protein [Prevotellaceae bacterium]